MVKVMPMEGFTHDLISGGTLETRPGVVSDKGGLGPLDGSEATRCSAEHSVALSRLSARMSSGLGRLDTVPVRESYSRKCSSSGVAEGEVVDVET